MWAHQLSLLWLALISKEISNATRLFVELWCLTNENGYWGPSTLVDTVTDVALGSFCLTIEFLLSYRCQINYISSLLRFFTRYISLRNRWDILDNEGGEKTRDMNTWICNRVQWRSMDKYLRNVTILVLRRRIRHRHPRMSDMMASYWDHKASLLTRFFALVVDLPELIEVYESLGGTVFHFICAHVDFTVFDEVLCFVGFWRCRLEGHFILIIIFCGVPVSTWGVGRWVCGVSGCYSVFLFLFLV